MRQILTVMGTAVGIAVLMGSCGAETPAAPDAAVVELAKAEATVAFTEGPTVDTDGNVYFTDTSREMILKYTPGAGVTVFREKTNAANGLIFDEKGRLIACEGGAARVTRMDVETGEIEVLAENSAETPITRPNDVTLDGEGRIYFTDYGGARVYRIDGDRSVHQILGAPDIEAPNGLVISPDNRTLYLVEANGKEGGARCLRAYDLAADGTVSNMRVFHDFYPGRSADGISIDTAGNVYAAAGLNRLRGSSETLDTKAGIHVFSPAGAQIGFHPIWEDTVTNCAFGGEDRKTLYVTAGKTLFSIRVDVAGTGR